LCSNLLDSNYAKGLKILLTSATGTISPATREPLDEVDQSFAKHFIITMITRSEVEISILQDIKESEKAFFTRNGEKWIHGP